MDNEKIVTIHIDEYLELKSTIEELRIEVTLYRNESSYLFNQVAKLEKKLNKKRKWYHLF